MDRTNQIDPPAVVCGWRERIALPAWGVKRLKAKADTGARTSAIDVSDLTELPGDRVRFHLVVDRAHPEKVVEVEADIIRRARVRSSLGDRHERLVVRTTMRLGPIEKEIEVGLLCRKNMLCRMLLGRSALQPDLLVDSSRTHILSRAPKRLSSSKRNAPRDGRKKSS
ncbi:MAG: hypothetical protein EA377_02170 [Phycisphaerales bacterium]|nr:MAG: hypothetical protein EA377_02170 [Phycisphaerales bacterium]